MDSILILMLLGLGIGTIGTLIGAGGGFILVPVLIILYPDMGPETITAISLAIVALNAFVGSVAYLRKGRVDFKAGVIFAAATIPGSIIGVYVNKFIPREKFDIIFGIVLIALAIFLFFSGGKKKGTILSRIKPSNIYQKKMDKSGVVYEYAYNLKRGVLIAVFIGFFSPLLGIGGGVIHVPAMTEILSFPVHIATATSQFILAIMAAVSVVVHYFEGSYDNPQTIKLMWGLGVGIIPGAMIGARISSLVKGKVIIRVLSISLVIIGIKILTSAIF